MTQFNPVDSLNHKLDSICPGVRERIDRLDAFPESVQLEVMAALLRQACDCQNVGNITTARSAFAKIPQACRAHTLDSAIQIAVDLTDDWHYRRLLELLQKVKSDRSSSLIALGLTSCNAEIREAAEDFSAI